MNWLLRWQHPSPRNRNSAAKKVSSKPCVSSKVSKPPAIEWERTLLPAPHRQLRPPATWIRFVFQAPVGCGRISPPPRLGHRRRQRPAPRHSYKRRAHHLLRPRHRRLAPSRSRRAVHRRAQTRRRPLARSPASSHPPSTTRSLFRQRHPADHLAHPAPANPARFMGASYRRPRRCRRLRPAPSHDGPPPQVRLQHHRKEDPQLRRPLVVTVRGSSRRSKPSRTGPPYRRPLSNPPRKCFSPATASSSAIFSSASRTPLNGVTSSAFSAALKLEAKSAAAGSSPASAASSSPCPKPSNLSVWPAT